jgi:hypothetical protein
MTNNKLKKEKNDVTSIYFPLECSVDYDILRCVTNIKNSRMIGNVIVICNKIVTIAHWLK